MTNNQQIGYIVGGGLKESFSARLTVDPLTVQEGGFVVIDSGSCRFYGKGGKAWPKPEFLFQPK